MGFDFEHLRGNFGHQGVASGSPGVDSQPLEVDFLAHVRRFLPLEIDFGSLRVDFRTHCERMFGVWETNWDLLESILALRGKFWLLRLNIGLLEMIVRL